MSAPEGESADPYIEDYEPYTTSMQFRVGQSAGSGRGLFASEALPQLTDLIDEVRRYPRVEFEEYDRSSNSTPEVTGKLPTVTQTPEKYKSEECEHEYNKRQRYKR